MFFSFIICMLAISASSMKYESSNIVDKGETRNEVHFISFFFSRITDGLKNIFSFFNSKSLIKNEKCLQEVNGDIENQNLNQPIIFKLYSFEYHDEKDANLSSKNKRHKNQDFFTTKEHLTILENGTNPFSNHESVHTFKNCFEKSRLNEKSSDNDLIVEDPQGETIYFASDLNFEPESVYTKDFRDYSRYAQYKESKCNFYYNKNFRYFLHPIQELDGY